MNDFQKSVIRFFYVLLCIGAVMFTAAFVWGGGKSEGRDYERWSPYGKGVTATGTCVVRTKPDLAELKISVWQSSLSARGADRFVKGKMKRVAEVLKEQGIDEKDIRTDKYSLKSQWKVGANVTTWNAGETLYVRIHDLEKVPDVLDAVIKVGSTSITDLQYKVSNFKELREKGRVKAAEIAKEKAAHLASNLGGSLGELVSCSEHYPDDYYNWRNAAPQANVEMDGMAADNSPAEEVSVQPGEIAVNVVVSATYELK